VRELSDAQALELQIIENNQREDLHPLEEAEGYEALLKCAHEDGRKYTVDDIVAKIARSRSYVYQKLKLCELCDEARKAFYAGTIDFSRAILLARIAGVDLQRKALKEITAPPSGAAQ
jgi:ParB/RepB/Spo0J family partition protein